MISRLLIRRLALRQLSLLRSRIEMGTAGSDEDAEVYAELGTLLRSEQLRDNPQEGVRGERLEQEGVKSSSRCSQLV
jgi:hypothetical protein